MRTEVLATNRADQQIKRLTRRHAKTFDDFPERPGRPRLVYAELYRLLDVEPEPGSGRTKPPCCDETEGGPPVLGDALTAILDRAASFRKTRQR
jgi:hypothetical protein